MTARDLVIFGTGGTCIDVLDIVDDLNSVDQRWRVIGFLDDNADHLGTMVHGIEVLGTIDSAKTLPSSVLIANPLGSPSRPQLKRHIFDRVGVDDARYATLVHPSASISTRSQLGNGTIIFPHVSVAAGARIGRQVTMLAGCRINHDDIIGDFATLANNVSLAGGVHVGPDAYLGIGAVVIGSAHIGERSIVGAGSAVIRPVSSGTIVAGCPARVIRSDA